MKRPFSLAIVLASSLACAQKYSRGVAVDYAVRYVIHPNPQYKTYDEDCTNFVSQCLLAGGWQIIQGTPRQKLGTDCWWPGALGVPPSYTWVNADYLKWFIQGSNRGILIPDWHDLQAGDVIGEDLHNNTGGNVPDGTIDHLMFVMANSGSDVLYAQHTDNKVHNLVETLSRAQSARFYYFHIYTSVGGDWWNEQLSPLYRYLNVSNGDHFYTTNYSELGQGRGNYIRERNEGRVFLTHALTTVPVYRYYNDFTGQHFFSVNYSELGDGAYGYRRENTNFFAWNFNPNPVNGKPFAIPVYRYLNGWSGGHFFTTDFSVLGSGRIPWVFEKIAWWELAN